MDKRAKERVAIAKDALAWIEAGALNPKRGVWILPTREPSVDENNKQLRDVVIGPCNVCALGSLFLSKAVRFDNVLAKNLYNYRNEKNGYGALADHFDGDQLYLIEEAFEGYHYDHYGYVIKYPNSKDRLIAILNNIINNKGTFVPKYF